MAFLSWSVKYLMRPEVRPFTYGFMCSYALGFFLARGGTEEERAASKYLNPPKHH